ncbi:peptide deformylase [Candidatus Venteria ishoeyi]|uniref:Peptide deformylase n=1 Tax=Candidatus Venteria ishoeyi TaxID=1899563 RepID=A0A1H6F701_9GAMM|nr:peptide deformylase [Candidatus Venteria ishoeyi]MDM8548162.1 peptide deformylase [Candidatus Venteria ishoeyi]SEH05201.1 Peptide deformylase [Candidatus Venteria ishoeyi]
MTVLDLLIYPDARLKNESSPVTVFDEKLHQCVAELEETMRAGPGGVGIAAPQTGIFQRIVIVDVSIKPKIKHHGCLILINPEILEWDGFEIGREGCMSVPDYTGNVIRARAIKLTAQDQYGAIHEYDMEGYEARAVQHEIDHLDGLLFIDRLVSRRHDLFQRKVYKKSNKKTK